MPTPTKKAAPKKAASAPKPIDHAALLSKLEAGDTLTSAESAEWDRLQATARLLGLAATGQRQADRAAGLAAAGPPDFDEETLADGSVVIYPHADHGKRGGGR